MPLQLPLGPFFFSIHLLHFVCLPRVGGKKIRNMVGVHEKLVYVNFKKKMRYESISSYFICIRSNANPHTLNYTYTGFV